MAKVTGRGKGCETCEDDQELAKPVLKLNYVSFSFDKSNNSLDIFLKRDPVQWNNGVGIQLNDLSDGDKSALELYLKSGK